MQIPGPRLRDVRRLQSRRREFFVCVYYEDAARALDIRWKSGTNGIRPSLCLLALVSVSFVENEPIELWQA